jgi:DNA-binding SARP family transcriptional activator
MALEIGLLGDVSIHGEPDGVSCSLSESPQTRLAFALLTVERHHGVSREALSAAMWPDGRPATWPSALRTIVSRVRAFVVSALGTGTKAGDQDPIVTRGGCYWLHLPGDAVVDVEQLEASIAAAERALDQGDMHRAHALASEAAERLRTPFFPDHDGDWAALQRRRLNELLVMGLEVTSRAAVALGDASSGLTVALEAVARAPLRESAHRCVMAARAAAGNRAEALRAYHLLRRLLADELGVDPDPETEAAYLRLLGQPLRPGPAPGGSGNGATALGPFVGREAELSEVSAAWSRVFAGHSQAVLVTGEAGIGKTRLATELARRVTTEGGLVLFGRCEQEATTPYQAFVDVLDALVAVRPDNELPVLTSAARAELAAVLPAFAGWRVQDRAPDRPVLFDAVSRLLRNAAADRPLLVVLDDLQWADADTSSLLRHVLRHVDGARLMMMVVARDDALPEHTLMETLRDLEHEGRLTRLRLGGLEERACRSLVHEIQPEADDILAAVPRLMADTSGNPFLLIELLRALDESTVPAWARAGTAPAALNDLVRERLAALGPNARALLFAGAATGSSFDLDVAGAAAKLDRAAALDAVDVALAAGLVTEVDGDEQQACYRFTHDIFRQTLYSQLSRARRRHLHERIADATELLSPADSVRDAPMLAHHRCAAAEPGGDLRAVGAAMAAAAHAAGRGAVAEAERWCREALENVTPGDSVMEAEVLTELGRVLTRKGDARGAATLLDAAARARRSRRSDIAARAALSLVEVAQIETRLVDERAALIQDLVATDQPNALHNGGRPTDVTWARLVAWQIRSARFDARTEATRAATAKAALQRRLGELDGPDHIDLRLALADDLGVIAAATEDPARLVIAQHHRATAAALAGDHEATEAALTAMAHALRVRHDPEGEALLADRALMLAVTQGRFDDAEAMAKAADRTGPTWSVAAPTGATVAARQTLVARWLQGRLGDGRSPTTPGSCDLSEADAAERALVAWERGDRGAVRLAVRGLVAGEHQPPAGDGRLHSLGVLGLVVVEFGDPALATDLRKILSPYAALCCGIAYRSFVGTVTFHLGRLAALCSDWAAAERHLVSALRQLTAMGARPWIALAQHSLADVIDARGRSSDCEWVSALRAEAQWLASDLDLRPLR